MRRRHGLLWLTLGLLLLVSRAMGQESLRWQPTLESAKRLAAQTDRLVLIHFWADWCQACRRMDREVFNQPSVIAAVQTYYVPVKINADYFPATRRQFGITRLPTDVIVTPQGQLIDKIQGRAAAAEYIMRLQQVASVKKGTGMGTYVQRGGSRPVELAQRATLPYTVPAYQPPNQYGPPSQNGAEPQPAGPQSSVIGPQQAPPPQAALPPQHVLPQQPTIPPQQVPPPVAVGPPAAARQTAPPPIQLPPGNPPLGLDGYCPVQLCDDMKAGKQRWTLGDYRWGARHRGRTYLFASPEHQRRFLAEPDRYAPVLSGNDVVTAIEQGKRVPGHREHGVFFGNKVYLFASEATLEEFSKRPNYYADQALQALQPGRYPAQRYR